MNVSDSLPEPKRAGHRIQIHTDSKRWWPNTMYHTYWSRLYYYIRKNIFIALMLFLFAIFMGIAMNMLYSTQAHMIKQAVFDEMEESANKGFILQPYHDRLVPIVNSDFLPPDTTMDWIPTNSSQPRAAFVVITREEEVFRLRATMIDVEERLNQNYNYPWVIISDKPLSKRFREWAISVTAAPVYFGLAPPLEWNEPYWIDIKRVEEGVKNKVNAGVNHGESISWRRMSRYAAGYLAYHPLLKDLEFYWKVQPGSQYSCDIREDPFQKMKDNNKKFSFLTTLTENHLAVVEFENEIKRFIVNNRRLVQPIKNSIYPALLNGDPKYKEEDASLERQLGDYKGKLSNCHILNNFMIVSLPFLRSKEYRLFFEAIDNTGGFFYDRWSDSFLQTFAVSLFMNKKDISYANIAGYSFKNSAVCPTSHELYRDLRCTCQPASYKVHNNMICLPRFREILTPK